MFGIQRVSWVRQPRQLQAIIAALHVEQERRHLLAEVEAMMAELDKGESGTAWRDDLVLPKAWRRDRRVLRQLVERLVELLPNWGWTDAP